MRIKSKVDFVIGLGCAVCLIINIANQRDAFAIAVSAVAAVTNLICAFRDEEGEQHETD